MSKKGTAIPFKTYLYTNYMGYVFILPWLFGFMVLTLWPMCQSFYLALTNYTLFDLPGATKFVGMGNYIHIFTKSTEFWKSLSITFTFVLFAVPFKMIFSLFVAMLLNRDIKGMSFYRTAIYLPSLIGGSIAVSILWRNIFGLDGYINTLLALVGIPAQGWIVSPQYALQTLILLNVWQFGSTMIIFLGGLKQIPIALYESASIDGAGAIRKFFNITLPMLSPVVFFNLILGVIGAFQQFTAAFIITKGGPMKSTFLYALMLYEKAFQNNNQMGYASALAWILLIIIGTLTLINFAMSKMWVFYEDGR